MTGFDLTLRDGSIAHCYNVAGLHLVASMDQDNVKAFGLVQECEAEDCDEFRRIWRELGGSFASDEAIA